MKENELKSGCAYAKLSKENLEGKIKTKNKLSYLPWSSAWNAVLNHYPDSSFRIIHQIMDDYGNTRPWHDDGKTGWVEVGVKIDGIEHVETLAIMNYKNEPISADKITSVDANKSIKRCLVKACALHGLGLYIYEGEDLPDSVAKVIDLQDQIKDIVIKKCGLSDEAKEKVGDFCKKAEKECFPDIEDSLITGNPKNIDDINILEKLKKQLLTVRK